LSSIEFFLDVDIFVEILDIFVELAYLLH